MNLQDLVTRLAGRLTRMEARLDAAGIPRTPLDQSAAESQAAHVAAVTHAPVRARAGVTVNGIYYPPEPAPHLTPAQASYLDQRGIVMTPQLAAYLASGQSAPAAPPAPAPSGAPAPIVAAPAPVAPVPGLVPNLTPDQVRHAMQLRWDDYIAAVPHDEDVTQGVQCPACHGIYATGHHPLCPRHDAYQLTER
jgi:hypothetical protein